MRIQASAAAATPLSGTAGPRRSSGGFSIADASAPRAAAATAAPRGIGGIDALIALQGIEDATERRRNGLKRGRMALDALDQLKLALLGGELSPATLASLKATVAGLKTSTGDPGLDGVLAEIELRVEVEIAKLSPH